MNTIPVPEVIEHFEPIEVVLAGEIPMVVQPLSESYIPVHARYPIRAN